MPVKTRLLLLGVLLALTVGLLAWRGLRRPARPAAAPDASPGAAEPTHSAATGGAATGSAPTERIVTGGAPTAGAPTAEAQKIIDRFNGQRALRDVEYQVGLGPRLPGSPAHRQLSEWLTGELQASGWAVTVQETTALDQPVRNIIAEQGSGRPWVVIGAHYDSRMRADQDPDPAQHHQPVPGANDGASGVAVLAELGRVLPAGLPGSRYPRVTLVFFDAEDNGRIPGWDWILGSRAYVAALQDKPDAAVVIDMIGDADLNIYQERNSNPALIEQIWSTAARLGYEQFFIPSYNFTVLDDHIPFIEAGIPAVDLIDFNYPYWHTRQDTPDKVSAQSLQIVGRTLLSWLLETP
ncbi:MAG: M28 family peptidase [Chloroflexota bacterium]